MVRLANAINNLATAINRLSAPSVEVQTFTSSGTWNKPPSAVPVVMVHGGCKYCGGGGGGNA